MVLHRFYVHASCGLGDKGQGPQGGICGMVLLRMPATRYTVGER